MTDTTDPPLFDLGNGEQTFPKEIICRLQQLRIVAGFSVQRTDDAVPLAQSLVAGGIGAIELTLRTPVGLQAVQMIAASVPELLIGVGTILTPQQACAARQAGAHFGVSPAMNPRVIQMAQQIGLPFAPGIASPSELDRAIELGCRFVKLFPAEALGGIEYLRSMSAPYQHLGLQYFPLGGIGIENMLDYLREPNVPAIGGSFLVKPQWVKEQDWSAITAQAKQVCDTIQREL